MPEANAFYTNISALVLGLMLMITGTILLLACRCQAQLSITPQFNTALPVGDTEEYGNPRMGYGLEVGYQLSKHFGVVVAYDRYRFELQSDREDFNINSLIVSLLNLPELLVAQPDGRFLERGTTLLVATTAHYALPRGRGEH